MAAVLDSAVLGQRQALEESRPVVDRRSPSEEVKAIGAGLHLQLFLQYWLQYVWGNTENGAHLKVSAVRAVGIQLRSCRIE
jgi:hypothetical protein